MYVYPILLSLLFLNACSFILYRTQWPHPCKIVHWRKPRKGRAINYFIAGTFNQPQYAFRFLTKEVQGGLAFAQFDNLGWNAFDTARAIAHDICKNRYRATIYTISVGDQVARYLEDTLGDMVKVITINPCTRPQVLKPFFFYGSKIVAPLLQLVCHLILGWLSALPILHTANDNYSLILLADQLMAIAYGDPPRVKAQTVGLVCSNEDEFLRNTQIIQEFANVPTSIIAAKHARTTEKPNLYLDAIRNLSKNTF